MESKKIDKYLKRVLGEHFSYMPKGEYKVNAAERMIEFTFNPARVSKKFIEACTPRHELYRYIKEATAKKVVMELPIEESTESMMTPTGLTFTGKRTLQCDSEGKEILRENTTDINDGKRYEIDCYYGRNYSGLSDSFSTDDYEEVKDYVWEQIAQGSYIEVTDWDTGKRVRLNPDDYDYESDDLYRVLDDLDQISPLRESVLTEADNGEIEVSEEETEEDSSEDDGEEELELDVDERYYVAAYFDSRMRGLNNNLLTNSFEEVSEFVWDEIQDGSYIEVRDQLNGNYVVLDPKNYDFESDDLYRVLDDLKKLNSISESLTEATEEDSEEELELDVEDESSEDEEDSEVDVDEEEEDEETSSDNSRYAELSRKTVYDSDGFMTDYTLYKDRETERYICILGDQDFYNPDNADPDAEFEREAEAYEWFNSYEGIIDEDDFRDWDNDVERFDDPESPYYNGDLEDSDFDEDEEAEEEEEVEEESLQLKTESIDDNTLTSTDILEYIENNFPEVVFNDDRDLGDGMVELIFNHNLSGQRLFDFKRFLESAGVTGAVIKTNWITIPAPEDPEVLAAINDPEAYRDFVNYWQDVEDWERLGRDFARSESLQLKTNTKSESKSFKEDYWFGGDGKMDIPARNNIQPGDKEFELRTDNVTKDNEDQNEEEQEEELNEDISSDSSTTATEVVDDLESKFKLYYEGGNPGGFKPLDKSKVILSFTYSFLDDKPLAEIENYLKSKGLKYRLRKNANKLVVEAEKDNLKLRPMDLNEDYLPSEFYTVRFCRVDGDEDEIYEYKDLKDAEYHFGLFDDSDANLYSCITIEDPSGKVVKKKEFKSVEEGVEKEKKVSFKDKHICQGCGNPLSKCTCEVKEEEELKEDATQPSNIGQHKMSSIDMVGEDKETSAEDSEMIQSLNKMVDEEK